MSYKFSTLDKVHHFEVNSLPLLPTAYANLLRLQSPSDTNPPSYPIAGASLTHSQQYQSIITGNACAVCSLSAAASPSSQSDIWSTVLFYCTGINCIASKSSSEVEVHDFLIFGGAVAHCFGGIGLNLIEQLLLPAYALYLRYARSFIRA